MPQTLSHPLALDAHADDRVRKAAAELALEGFSGPGVPSDANIPEFSALTAVGTEFWLDTGDHAAIEPFRCRELTAVTTNNTLVNQVVQHGSLDALIPEAARRLRGARSLPDADLMYELGFVANARIALSLVQEFGTRVSVELHPSMADDIEASLLFARRYYALCPERFIIKVPLQPAGFLVVRRLRAEGIPINYTLGFSARQNYLATLFSRPSYVNVFLGRLNSVVEENGIGKPENIGEKAALASQEAVSEARRADPSISTRQIAASIRSGRQVADLAGVDVQTIPPKAAEEFRAMTHGPLRLKRPQDLAVTLSDSNYRAEVESLWTIDDEFRRFASAAAGQETSKWTAGEFAAFARDHGIRLFHDWSPDEVATVRSGGKIPKLAQWDGVPLDDLMTQAALQSFVTDQQALDDRLAGLAH